MGSDYAYPYRTRHVSDALENAFAVAPKNKVRAHESTKSSMQPEEEPRSWRIRRRIGLGGANVHGTLCGGALQVQTGARIFGVELGAGHYCLHIAPSADIRTLTAGI